MISFSNINKQCGKQLGGWPIFALHHSHGGRPILAFFARACPELVEGVGGDAAGATLVRSTPPVVYAVVVPALRLREGRGTRICGGFCSLKAGHPPRPRLGFRNGPALRYVQISRMTIIKTPTSYFACASFVTTAASLSSIWFQPSI
jgi:hypothetical protein